MLAKAMEKEKGCTDGNVCSSKVCDSSESITVKSDEEQAVSAALSTAPGATTEDSEVEDSPFAGMLIASHSALHDVVGRTKCPGCQASRKWFCYTCFRLMGELEGKVPQVELPIKLDIIKHPKELEGRSTAVHAAVLAPSSVTVHVYPRIPELEEKDKVVLVFPSSSAISLQDYAKQCCKKDMNHHDDEPVARRSKHDEDGPDAKKTKYDMKVVPPFNRVLFIDSTWNQTAGIFKDERLKGIQCVVLKSAKTSFWRRQEGKPDSYLATIEAVYHFMVQYHELFVDPNYDGRYDNLLYLYSFLHKVVQENIDQQKLQGKFRPRNKSRKKQREVTV
ncbi:tRNA-uridine aminocarboxypropyltransferase 1-like [Glandiceps talaboti]